MKKGLFVILGLLLAGNVFAQSELKFYYDFNYAGFYDVPKNETTTAKTGMGGGFSYLYGRKFFIEPGVMYAEHRKAYEIADGEVEHKYKIKEQMLKVPLHLGVHLLGNERSHCAFRLFLGPTYSCSLKSSVEVSDLKTLGDKFDFNRSRFGVDAGIGLNLYFFFVDVLYEHEFSKFSDEVDSRNLGLQVNAGLRFKLNVKQKREAKDE